MATRKDVTIPDLGNFQDVPVLEVVVKVGDSVEAEAPLITLESDKATMDVPAPFAGKVVEIKTAAGSKVNVGDVIAVLEVADGAGAQAPAKKDLGSEGGDRTAVAAPVDAGASGKDSGRAGSTGAPAGTAPPQVPSAPPPSVILSASEGSRASVSEPSGARPSAPAPVTSTASFAATPVVRRYARELGVDLSRVRGSARGGRITREDVQGFVKSALAGARGGAGAVVSGSGLPFSLDPPAIDFSKFGPVETKALSRIKKVSATHLHRSWLSVPHVTQFDEADITEMEAFRNANADAAKAQGFKLTPLAFLLKAVAVSIDRYPQFASSLAPGGESLVMKGYRHVGVAVDTPEGLVVPVIRDVDKKGLMQLARELQEVSQKARDRKLRPDDLSGGVFSISSLGGIGGTNFTPIVNSPEVAILGVARSSTKPVWRDGLFVPRLILPLALSYDHRVIDGAEGARFITHLTSVLQDIRQLAL
jgi:pyruvate dehydrogenase E2 component (dihydrolipoamide acetyltransferase)